MASVPRKVSLAWADLLLCLMSASFVQAFPWFDLSGFSLVFVCHYVSSLGCLCRALRYHPSVSLGI